MSPLPQVMGILNVTPDSFSDGGRYACVDQVVATALEMVSDGAAILDIGGESTRPGASAVSVEQELDRVIPVIEKLRPETSALLSIDTSKPAVMSSAIAAGVDIVNDVCALTVPGALETVAASTLAVKVCLMHKQGSPDSMQQKPCYTDVLTEVLDFLKARVEICVAQGIQRSSIWIDPGFGFGKTLEHNLTLMKNIEAFQSLQLPILIGVSRKSMIGQLLDRDLEDRMVGGLAFAAWSMMKGVSIIRTHDVKPTVEIVKVFSALNESL